MHTIYLSIYLSLYTYIYIYIYMYTCIHTFRILGQYFRRQATSLPFSPHISGTRKPPGRLSDGIDNDNNNVTIMIVTIMIVMIIYIYIYIYTHIIQYNII